MMIQVFGDPAPQGSKRVFNGRVVEAAGNKLKLWRKAVASACHNLRSEEHSLMLGPVRVEVDFYLLRPSSVTLKKRALPIVPPDLDKLLRSTLDGIGQGYDTGKVGDGMTWGDDSQVVEIFARKFYADDREPGADIKITAL
jgi:Holliday junction resolvase RusA-like endonuclease